MAIKINGIKVAGLGPAGKSAYESAKDGGFSGTEQEFNNSLGGLMQTDLKYTKSNVSIENDSVKFSSVAYGNGIYVAVENNETGVVATSEDGLSWENVSSASYSYWSDIIYANGKFVAIGYDPTSLTDVSAYATGNLYDSMMYSTDGKTWTVANGIKDIGPNWSSIAYGDGKFVAFSIDGMTAAYSTNLETWNSVTIPSEYSHRVYITYGNGKFVAVGNCMAFYSNDGVAWTSTNIGNMCTSVCFGDGKFVAVCSDGGVLYSDDGVSWSPVMQDESYSWSSVTFGDDNFIAVSLGSDVAIISDNGINWQYKKLPFSAEWTDVTYSNHKYLAVNSDNTTTCLIELSKTVDFATQYQLELQNDFINDKSWTTIEMIPYDGNIHTLSEWPCNTLVPLSRIIDLSAHNYEFEVAVYGLTVTGATDVNINTPSVCLCQDKYKDRYNISISNTETVSSGVIPECDWPTPCHYNVLIRKGKAVARVSGSIWSTASKQSTGYNTQTSTVDVDESYYNYIYLNSNASTTTHTYGLIFRYRPIL